MKRRKLQRRKSKRQKLKDETFRWMSRYVRLLAAVEYTKIHPDAANGIAPCVTCGKILDVKYEGEAGHFMGRGMGGSSGVYFDERNVHLQCSKCNAWEAQNVRPAYREYLVKKYGEKVVNELELFHKIKSYTDLDIIGLGIYYKEQYENLCKQIGRDTKW